MRLRKVIEMCVVTLCVLLNATVVYGKENGMEAERAAQVKAGLVYRLSELTQWPEGIFELDTTPITVGVLGADPHGFADYFRVQSANFTAQGRSFIVRKFPLQVAKKSKDDLAETLKKAMHECNVLFVTSAATGRFAQIIAETRKSGVLTVGETETFSAAGGMVSFVTDRGSVKIYVNLPALKNGRINTSSEFLRHAHILEGK